MVNILIDELTNSIRHRATNTSVETVIEKIKITEINQLKNWQFDWQYESRQNDIYKLTVNDLPDEIQGVISIEVRKGYVFVSLIENAPFNIGKHGVYEGVAGNLFAYACKLSYEMGFEGFVSFVAKTELIEHYKKKILAKLVSGQTMVIEPLEALQLIRQYFKES
jgi:hypothetical protein